MENGWRDTPELRYAGLVKVAQGSDVMDEHETVEQKPVLNGVFLAAVLMLVGLCALAMLVLAAAAVVFR